jgi:hypothetical protein
MGEQTPYERLGWRLQWPAIIDENLDDFLGQRLAERFSDWPCPEEVLQLWRLLAAAEAIDYLGHQLNESSLPREWSQDAVPVLTKAVNSHPLSQIRYFVWAAVRAGNSTYMRRQGDERSTRDAIVRELVQRPLRAQSESWTIRGFLPTQPVPFSLAAEALAKFLLPRPEAYWTLIPSSSPWEEE